MDSIAAWYSSSESTDFNSLYSFAHALSLSSNAMGSPPQPAYFAKTSCSSGDAGRPAVWRSCKRRIAEILFRNFSFALTAAGVSLVMRKFRRSLEWAVIFSLEASSSGSICNETFPGSSPALFSERLFCSWFFSGSSKLSFSTIIS